MFYVSFLFRLIMSYKTNPKVQKGKLYSIQFISAQLN